MRYCTLLALPLLIVALSVPHAGAQKTHIQSGGKVGCGIEGYSMLVPSDWTFDPVCSDIVTVISPSSNTLAQITTERHGYWNDQRSRASITADIQHVRNVVGTITIQFPVINGVRFTRGVALTKDSSDQTEIDLELETYANGYLYKFEFPETQGQGQGQSDTDGILSMEASIHITPISRPRPQFTIKVGVNVHNLQLSGRGTLSAQTVPGAECSPDVSIGDVLIPSLHDAKRVVPASGQVTWVWAYQDPQMRSGTASVACTYQGFTKQTFKDFTIPMP